MRNPIDYIRTRIGWTALVLTTILAAPCADTGWTQTPRRQERTEYETSDGTAGYRRLVTTEEDGNRKVETWAVETSSVNGGYDPILQVEEETVTVDDQTTRVTRREYSTDSNGRPALIATIEEERVESASGAVSVTRDINEVDANGRSRTTRRETESTSVASDGSYETRIEVLRPALNRSGLLPAEQVTETGRRDSDGRVVESDRTSWADSTQRGDWEPLERRIRTHEYGANEVSTVENVYRPNASGELTISEQLVSREWIDSSGREQRTEEVYSTDIPGERSLRAPELLRQVAVTRTETPDGGWNLTREVRESRQGRFRMVERETETARPNRGGGMAVERVVERLDANGRMRPVQTSTGSGSER